MSSAKEKEEQEFRERVAAKKKKLEESRFWQQKIPTWRPKYDANHNFWFFLLMSLFFWGAGSYIWNASWKIDRTDAGSVYSNHTECATKPDAPRGEKNYCEVDVDVYRRIVGPVYVYYKIDNMYQNHRRYVKSRSYSQLAGKYLTAEELETDCDPIYKVGHLWEAQQYNLNGKKMDPEAPATPCGLMAKSFFNDTFQLFNKSTGQEITWRSKPEDIAWATDVGKFKNIRDKDLPDGVESYKDIQWQDMEDPHFIVWMRNAGLPSFRKLIGIIDADIQGGQYFIKVDSQYNVAPFEGKKSFLLTSANVLGGKNTMLWILYYITATITSASTVFFLFHCNADRHF